MESYKSVFGKYEVSNNGNVRNSKTGRVLSQQTDKCGYRVVCLCENNKRHMIKVHRLVAQAFIPNDDNKPQIDHIDGNKENNVSTNLRWATPKENINNPITRPRHLAKIKPPVQKRIAVVCVDTNKVYGGLREAERDTNVPHSSIAACCKGKWESAGGYRWRFA